MSKVIKFTVYLFFILALSSGASYAYIPFTQLDLSNATSVTVPNFPSLQAFNPSLVRTLPVVCTLGHTNPADGGAGCYVWVAGDLTPPNGTTIVASAVAGIVGNWYLTSQTFVPTALPTTLPSTPGVMWNNGGVLSIS